ncbi:hypothetical protein ACFSKU_03765 [Pontibacter silvestris]|uniref:Uncharacterized protein n=1 Tax=Pontibacter silvestris TaxID=2305183 RepID=A0ABW4WUY3_9BACT|nr:hypothetical protein [Pontibacter silvestris]
MILKGEFSHAKPGEKVTVNVPYDVWYHKQNSKETTVNSKGDSMLSCLSRSRKLSF